MSARPVQVFLLYQFFHPDEVISARLFSDVAEYLAQEGRAVTAMPAARLFDNSRQLPKYELWKSVAIRRLWRPAFKQSSNFGRILNALVMLIQWTFRAAIMPRYKCEAVIVGTDPILSVLVAIPWRLLRPRSLIIHWCHDLHPEAAIADGLIKDNSWLGLALKQLVRFAYRRCDAIVDLGPCMRERLMQAAQLPGTNSSRFHTITPWALVERTNVRPPDLRVRTELFGQSKLAILYSGNLGRAHDFELFVELARTMREDSVTLCFAGRGQRMTELKKVVSETSITNIRFAGFSEERELEQRLTAGDVHLVSLRDAWTGTVVPSKFFGSLAMGRPILFVGSEQCAIAHWIKELKVGWFLEKNNVKEVAAQLLAYAQSPSARQTLNQHCLTVYNQHFSRAKQLTSLSRLLSPLDHKDRSPPATIVKNDL